MLYFYQQLTARSAKFLDALLEKRIAKGKEDPKRLSERKGIASNKRPKGHLIWLHAASVGEAQSALILINAIVKQYPGIHILVTTGTVTSAKRMAEDLPKQAFHQFVPMDHPDWVERFLSHWQPDLVLWMESELWPNMLLQMKERNIPMALINARLSDRSYRRWRLFRSCAAKLLESFDIILAQTDLDAEHYQALGAKNVEVSDNIKYSARALPHDDGDFKSLQAAILNRPLCVYASTHAGEEEMILRVHNVLQAAYPDMLSIIIPRHPDRGEEIYNLAKDQGLDVVLRGSNKALPDDDTQIYIANTMGELGLFYRLADIVYIGRSMSKDGGGGHNPIEAAQLSCAILHGPNIQNLQDIYDDMEAHHASKRVQDEQALIEETHGLLNDDAARHILIRNALDFSQSKSHVIDHVMDGLEPLFEAAGFKTS